MALKARCACVATSITSAASPSLHYSHTHTYRSSMTRPCCDTAAYARTPSSAGTVEGAPALGDRHAGRVAAAANLPRLFSPPSVPFLCR